jgi:hypothetical protein
MNLRHFIIVRVNLRYASYGPDFDPSRKGRSVELLNACARPSLHNQTNQNFTLFTLWGEHFAGGELDNEIPLVVTPENLADRLLTEVKTRAAGADRILASRLDSDDCISDNYVQVVQDQATRHSGPLPWAFDVESIYQLRASTGELFGPSAYNSSPFAAIVEDGSAFQAWIARLPHSSIAASECKGPIQGGSKLQGVYGLQTIHACNVLNKVRSKNKGSPTVLSSFFGKEKPELRHLAEIPV